MRQPYNDLFATIMNGSVIYEEMVPHEASPQATQAGQRSVPLADPWTG